MDKKLIAIFGSVIGLFALVLVFAPRTSSLDGVLGGGNLPDRCEFYDQVASRSVKDNVKASGGMLYSYRIVSNATQLRYFRIHDLATVPTTGATVEYGIPLDTTTASATPKVIEEKFAVPMQFDNGIAWSLSNNFGTWGSVSADSRDSYFVSLCYY